MIVVIKEKNSNEISDIVRDLKSTGYKIGIDFDFEYSAGKYDYSTSKDIPRQTKFTFYNTKLGLMFALRWSECLHG